MPKPLLVLLAWASPLLAQSVPIFDDVPSYQGYYHHVNMMRLRFVTMGCTYVPSQYCPNDNLTRGQAAVMIIRSIYSAKTGNPEGFSYDPNLPQYFSDVPKSYPQQHPQYVYIQKMAELGITSGCQSGMFCPDDPINYAQLAIFAIRARMIRDTGSIFALDCNAAPGTFANYPCSPSFGDVPSTEFFFPYVQKVNQLIGWQQSMAHDCWPGGFCPYSNAVRGRFAYYAVSVIMNATSPSLQPNGGNLPGVEAPYNYPAGITMSCAPGSYQVVNRFEPVDANNVYSVAHTGYISPPPSPSLWIPYVWRQLLGPGAPQPSTMDSRLGNATPVTLSSPNFQVGAGQTFTQTTKHGVFSGCVSPPPADFPNIVSTATETVAQTTQTFNTSPIIVPLTVAGTTCNDGYTACSFTWLSGSTHGVAAPSSVNMGGIAYQFTGWSSGAGSPSFTYTTPLTNSTVTATYTAPTVTTTITSSPIGRSLSVDGSTCTAPCSMQWTPGTNHTISAVSPQGSGTRYVFVSWSDGLGQAHTITAPATSTTYTATFTTQYLLTTSVTGSGSIQTSPVSGDGYFNSGTVVQIAAIPASGQQFTGFSGNLSGTVTPQNLAMTGPMTVTGSLSASSTPNISGISPTSGTIGTPVTITGTGLGTSGTVSFNGTPAQQIDSWSPTTVIAHVPAGATSGVISLSTGGYQTSYEAQQFQVTSVTVSPTSATLGQGQTQQFTATVTGTSNQQVNWSVAPTGAWNISSAGLFTAPGTIAALQTVTVTATSVAQQSATGTATVILAPPSTPAITSLSLPSGPRQVGFVINGSNFGTGQGTVIITGLSGENVELTVVPGGWLPDRITVQVPATTPLGAGQVSVRNSAGTASNQRPFTVSAAFGCNF